VIAPPKPCAKVGRKVRAPQGTMLANGEGERSYGKCHRKENANPDLGRDAKLKRWCKRPPASQRCGGLANPIGSKAE